MAKDRNDVHVVKLVVIDDDVQHLRLVQAALQEEGLRILTYSDPQQGLEGIFAERPDIVIVDLVMPKLTGMEILERVSARHPEIDVILMTGQYSTDSAVEAIQKGAADYFEKPLSIVKLQNRLKTLIERIRCLARGLDLERQLLDSSQFEGIIGRGPMMLEMFAKIQRIAPHFRTALITGSTGTGKELVARALHRLSPASSGQFAVCNCSAVVETLFESELFGHVKGSFTGATHDRVGLFEYANNGVVFLDEIGDMPLTTQAKVLRVLQNQEIQRVGSPGVKRVNVRVVAATHRDLRAEVREGRFREDLLFRLAVVEIKTPRLAERMEDLPLLTRHFVQRFSKEYGKPIRGLTARAQAALARHSWPGNVRELENAIASACMMAQEDQVDVRDLPETVRAGVPRHNTDDGLLPLKEVERRHVLKVVAQLGGNKARAAEVLGIGRTTLYRILSGEGSEPEQALGT